MRLIEQFHSSYFIEPNTSCWLWTEETYKDYGILWIGGSRITAYRLSYYLHKGEIPQGMSVCHSCDTPSCVNPEHLWIGTQTDNLLDAHSKGIINNKGIKNGSSKLDENKVLDIVNLYATGNYTQKCWHKCMM